MYGRKKTARELADLGPLTDLGIVVGEWLWFGSIEELNHFTNRAIVESGLMTQKEIDRLPAGENPDA